MNEQLTKFETAKLAKKMGFRLPLNSYNDYWSEDGSAVHPYKWFTLEKLADYIDAPTQSLLQRWLREEHGIQVFMKPYYDSKEKKTTFACDIMEIIHTGKVVKSHRCDTYEDALEEALVNGLNMVKELNKLKDE